MSTSTNRLAKTLSEITPDDLPTFSSLDNDITSNAATTGSSISDFFTNITWQTWLIIILILAFLGINIFSYLKTGTEEIVRLFSPLFKLFGYETLETTKQTVETSAIGAKAGVDIIADTTIGAINTIERKVEPTVTTNTSKIDKNVTNNNNTIKGKRASSSLSINNAEPVNNQVQFEQKINEMEDWQQNNLQKALDDSSKIHEVSPDDSLSRIQTQSGKSGWCYIGEDRGFRTCSEIGVNDQCMSGDIFPSQEICMNPKLRA
jgi:hypothetical protein